MFKAKKFLLVLLTTSSLIFFKDSQAKLYITSNLYIDSEGALKATRALTVLTKLGFAIAANVQELKGNELAALKLEIAYLCLDIADTALKMVDDFKSVSLLEEGVGIYHLVKIFQNIKEIRNKKSAEPKKKDSTTTNNPEKNKKQQALAKKIIYSIIKYYALASEAGSSIIFTSSDEDTRIASSNLSGFIKLLFDLIDNATPQVRSKALLLLAPVALATSFTIAKDQQKNREKVKKEAEDKKRKEEEKHMEEEHRKEREKQEREEAERKQKQREQEEKEKREQEQKFWDSLSDEEKKQEQERRKRKAKQEEDERNFQTNQEQTKKKFWKDIKKNWENLKREKRQSNRFSSFSIPTFSNYNHNSKYSQSPFSNQFGFRNPFDAYRSPFDSYNPFNSHSGTSNFFTNSFNYTDPFDNYFNTFDPDSFLTRNSFKIGSNDLSDKENKKFWDNVKEQWNKFKEQQEQEKYQFQEQQSQHQEEENRKKEESQRKKSRKKFFEGFFSGFTSNIPSNPSQQTPNYYEILGVNNNASTQELNKACLRLIKISHPDKNENSKEAEEATKFLNTIKQTLTDPNNRTTYDNNPSGVKTQAAAILDFIEAKKKELNKNADTK